VSSLFERFEEVSDKIQEDLRPAHRTFGQRRLHPLLLCAPFIYRCYSKPLGYAGDYEMMNMIIRNGYEGSSLYAKLVNAYLLDQGPAHAVRNRVDYLTNRIIEETARISREGRTAKIYNVACGPAREVERFVAEHPLADGAHFRLLDFSEETLRCASSRVNEAKRKHHRKTGFEIVKNSVQALLKAQSKGEPQEQRYDLIYSSGLYDYLSDQICKRLNGFLYSQLRPGGVLIVGNFAPSTSIRNFMEHFLEWFLIYRDPQKMMSLIPDQASLEHCVVRAESTGSNVFCEVRRPT
jgi:extracellular factor (EF) 3-hydroxypalmitic acid methyl ester biosynthesis protein